MMMHPETTNREAFTLLMQAQDHIKKYSEFRELGKPAVANESLAAAAESLNKALTRDPRYLGALYYRGVVDDLRGRPNAAVEDLERVLRGVEEFTQKYKRCWPTIEQVKYNLAVAYYHRYGHDNLEAAARYFSQVMEATEKNGRRLYLLAQAGLAQAYAMRMIPELPKEGSYEACLAHLKSETVREDVKDYFNRSKTQSDAVLSKLEKEGVEQPGGEVETNEISWIAYNARAIALLYYTDFYDDGRMDKLNAALAALEKGEALSPNNWSLYCNIGSAHMRLGHWLQEQSEELARPPQDMAIVSTNRSDIVLDPAAEKHFENAEERLEMVIDTLRPKYGFALYELGRNCRLMSRFKEARTRFGEAQEIPVADRAVSDERLNLESTRAELSLTDYP